MVSLGRGGLQAGSTYYIPYRKGDELKMNSRSHVQPQLERQRCALLWPCCYQSCDVLTSSRVVRREEQRERNDGRGTKEPPGGPLLCGW